MPSSLEIQLAANLAQLDASLCRILHGLPGAVELQRFGSVQQGSGDSYSDLDFQLFSNDPAVTIETLLPLLHTRKPIDAVYLIEAKPDTWAAALIFADASLFHKVDLGIRPISSREAWLAATSSSVIWTQEPVPQRDPPLAACPAFQPEAGTHAHFVLGELLGVTRYVKARKRGQVLSCWRFASALAHATMSLHMAIMSDRRISGSAMTTEAFKAADSLLPMDEREQLLRHLDFSRAGAMDETVRHCANDLVHQLRTSGAGSLPESLVERFRQFLDAYLGESGHYVDRNL